jgi:hypothetical protein
MKRLTVVFVILLGLFAISVKAQTTTNCYLTAGNTMRCTSSGSSTPPPIVVAPAPAPNPEAWRQAGEDIGAGIGAIAIAIHDAHVKAAANKAVNNVMESRVIYCQRYPKGFWVDELHTTCADGLANLNAVCTVGKDKSFKSGCKTANFAWGKPKNK